MKIINNSEIKNEEIKPREFVNWIEHSLSEKNNSILPAKISMKPSQDTFYNIMPTVLFHENIAGVKVINRYPNRKQSLSSQIMLYDLDNGSLKAILDGDYITDIRTGAVAVQSIKMLAVENFSIISFIGLGAQAQSTVKILLDYFSNRQFTIKLKKYKNQHLDFSEYINKCCNNIDNVNIEFCDTYDETIKDSDVIISAITYTNIDLISDPNLFKQGALLIPIHTRGYMNCDKVFDKVYGDDVNHIKGFKNFSEFRGFAETADVITGSDIGRRNDNERIIAYNIGIAIHDIYFANRFYYKIGENN